LESRSETAYCGARQSIDEHYYVDMKMADYPAMRASTLEKKWSAVPTQ
jgi:hypothetical protein